MTGGSSACAGRSTTCDIVRLDHFRGFEAYWEIPADEPTAVNGHWVEGPNDDLFEALRSALGKLPFIAEDLGYITPEVHDLRKEPGNSRHEDSAIWIRQSRARMLTCRIGTIPIAWSTPARMTTTPTVGWWNTGATAEEKKLASAYLGIGEDGVHWAFIRAALTSVANLCRHSRAGRTGPGSEARMNVPSETGDQLVLASASRCAHSRACQENGYAG